MPRPDKRQKARERRARETQAAQQSAEKKKITPAQYMRWRALGWGPGRARDRRGGVSLAGAPRSPL